MSAENAIGCFIMLSFSLTPTFVSTPTVSHSFLDGSMGTFQNDQYGFLINAILHFFRNYFKRSKLETLPSCVEDVQASIDLDGDGDITKDKFVRNALKNNFISQLSKYKNDLP